MRDEYPFGTTQSMSTRHITSIPAASPNLNRSSPSVASPSTQVGHLVRRAMNLFDTDRLTAWRCLGEASTLLGVGTENPRVDGMIIPEALQSRGLAAWQTKRALAYIDANLGSKIRTADLAKMAALSVSYFYRAFKHSLGSSPMQYVGMRRLEHAKSMMRSSKGSLAEIALACGFADQAHLNRRFREVVGVSPGRWRRVNAAEPNPLFAT